MPNIHVDDWKKNARDNSEGAFPQLLDMLWEVVAEIDPVLRAKLLSYVTGSGRLPAQVKRSTNVYVCMHG